MLALAIEFSRCSRVAPSKLNSVSRTDDQPGAPRPPNERRRKRVAKWLLRKEVIQPHLPVRLPCYDFTPIASPTFDGSLHKGWATGFGCCPLPWCDGRCVQGPGTYSPRHADPRLLAIPTSWSRVADSNPDYDALSGIGSPSRVGNPLYAPLYDVCSPTHKGHEDLTSSPPSSGLSPAVPLECSTECSN